MHKLQRIYWKLFKNVFVSSTSEFDVKEARIQSCRINVSKASRLVIGRGSQLVNCTIDLMDGSTLKIGENVVLRNMCVTMCQSQFVCGDACRLSNAQIELLKNSKLSLGEACVVEQGDWWRGPIWRISDGSQVNVADHNRIRCNIEARFEGKCKIGQYNCLNEDTEIRTDESVVIGDYNMISYHCRIWDTDTHCFYQDDTRRRMTERMYPIIGAEKEKPVSRPVEIGSDNLIGERAAILKGSAVGNYCKVGYGVVVANKKIANHTTFVGKSILK